MRSFGRFNLAIMLTAFALSSVQASGTEEPVGREEAAQWTRWVIPLPREIAIANKTLVTAGQIAITVAPNATPLVRCAAAELAEALQQKTGARVAVGEKPNTGAKLEILLGTCAKDGRMAGQAVPGAERLAGVSCPEQAYRIVPLGDRRLALVGLRPEGVYYAAKTLKQLVSSTISSAGQGQAAIPLADVTDWPDLAERGLWGGSANQDIEWMADRKMNLVESHVALSVGPDGRGTAVVPDKLIERAQRHAVNLVPIVTHLEQLPAVVFTRFPQLKAVGDEKAWRRVGAVTPVCFSQPKAQELLSDWLGCLARYPEVTDVNVWLSENSVPCECEKCKPVNPFVLQTRLALAAWKAAQKVKPSLRLRILLTQGSYKSNDQVLAAVPRDVGITYYDGGRTYDSSRNPMIYPLMEKFAAEGHWLGCYPQVTPSWRIVAPWSGPQFIKARMQEFVSKGLKCLCGYATPSNRFSEFNVTAAAEWSWNAQGRSERDFSLAWATRERLADPEKAADWAVTLGPVGWDVYGSQIPYRWVWGNAATGIVRPGKPPQLGKGIFTYFPTKEHFDADLAACQRAMSLAEDLRAPALIEETRTIRGFVRMAKGLYLLGEAVSAGKKMNADDRKQAAEALALVDQGGRDASRGLQAWGDAVTGQTASTTGGSRYGDTVSCVERAMADIGDAAEALGIRDPNRPYRLRKIGEWKTEDFDSGASQTKTWEVTKYVTEPGRYRVEFVYSSGWYGASIKRVTLVSTPTNDPAQQTELARDVHHGTTGHRPKNTVYELALEQYDPARRYFVVADIIGVTARPNAEHSGCAGHATLNKVREP